MRSDEPLADAVVLEIRQQVTSIFNEQAAAAQRLARIEAMLGAFVQQAAQLAECRRELLEARLQLVQVKECPAPQAGEAAACPPKINKTPEDVIAEVHRLLASIGAKAPTQARADSTDRHTVASYARTWMPRDPLFQTRADSG